MSPDIDQLRRRAEAALNGGAAIPGGEWRAALDELAAHLQRPMSLPETERIEGVLKSYLRVILRPELAGGDARFLALWQRDLGFLLKYKSYGVKCATPLGYSVFLLSSGEGFSFQRHLTRKTEIFHILEPHEHALAFFCTSAQWTAIYERERFGRWLEGARDAELDALARRPEAGDVYHVSDLGTVHTVLGCVLEEFATVSIDLVDRLHDQNIGREVRHVPRDVVTESLRRLPGHPPRMAATEGEASAVIIRRGNAQVYLLATGPIDATRLHVQQGMVELPADRQRARILFTVHGSASCELRGSDESPDFELPAIDVRGGDLLLIAPGVATTIDVAESAAFSVHGIEPELALA